MNKSVVIKLSKAEKFEELFTQHLGWNHTNISAFPVEIKGGLYTLRPVAESGGLVVLHCPSDGATVPASDIRRAIDQAVTKRHYEHIIIFTDSTRQIWQWVKREKGSPNCLREHTYWYRQPGEAFYQRISGLLIGLDELDDEGNIHTSVVTAKAQNALDIDRVTKRFYDKFAKQLAAFKKFIDGIPIDADRDHYASLMLNRLMFIYFIQKKKFLDGDVDYLKHKLELHLQKQVEGEFYTFYKSFLRRLFAEGLNSPERNPELKSLFGNVPYLNGGLYEQHRIEIENSGLNIPDEAFQKVFAFFDEFQWHLDDRPTRKDDEINPDVLGYIFEKFINQKQMGAYYTKEDITEYISKSTIIPFLFDELKKKCQFAFEGEQSVWKLLQANPSNYIYPAMKQGIIDDDGQVIPESVLPKFVQTGMHDPNARMFDQNYNLKAADYDCEPYPPMTLPTETWREYAARRTRCLEVFEKLSRGEVQQINDLITYNLDIRQFAQDVVESTEDPGLLNAVWKTLNSISVLDPTCGSGAFLFAAMNILEPLYESTINRMEEFVDAWSGCAHKVHPRFNDTFTGELKRIEQHPNTRYFVYKRIILNNLYGVDIMHEAVEICKLRLFLKLASLVDPDHSRENMGLEPLPDIDFNIKAGNTLVGFATEEEAQKIIRSALDYENVWAAIHEKIMGLSELMKLFRKHQTDSDHSDHFVSPKDKEELRDRLSQLNDELNRYLARKYGMVSGKYSQFLSLYQPFHWFTEFHEIMGKGGFNVIIGNPPYVEITTINKQYSLKDFATTVCGNLYAPVIERSLMLLKNQGYNSMIVQLPLICTDRMRAMQRLFTNIGCSIWFASFDDRPARLFDGLEHIRAVIYNLKKQASISGCSIMSTKYMRWYSSYRPSLFEVISYCGYRDEIRSPEIASFPKLGDRISLDLFQKLKSKIKLGMYLTNRSDAKKIYYHNAPQYWIRAMDVVPYFWNERNGEQASSQIKPLFIDGPASLVISVLNSSIFIWWFLIWSDCRHLNSREIVNFPIGLTTMSEECQITLQMLSGQLMESYETNKVRKSCHYKSTGNVTYDEYYPRHSKSIIDKIDGVLAEHYGLSGDELDFIVNYDIKFRMGLDGDSESVDES